MEVSEYGEFYMSKRLRLMASRWQTLAKAIERKNDDPLNYHRAYIGNLQTDSSFVDMRRYAPRRPEERLPADPVFFLGSPYHQVGITRRELQVLYLICYGSTNSEVAKRLQLSIRTVEYYIKNLRRKLLVDTKCDLVRSVCATDFLTRVDGTILVDRDILLA
jgi:DNA-binding CsgD family transcriptional regulator